MQLASIPAAVITANTEVLGALRQASVDTTAAQAKIEGAKSLPAGTQQLIMSALASAQQAVAGVSALGSANLLDGAFQRYSNHSVRHLEWAAKLVSGGDAKGDALSSLARSLNDAEIATRLGTEAGDRSMARPSHKALERANDFASGNGDSVDRGPVWVDGQWLDGLGNPVRTGNDTGPDGVGSGWDGMGDRGDSAGSFTGPDGVGYSGI